MKKLLALLILIPTLSFAQPKAPETTVWVEPKNAKPGEEIGLNAFIYNSENQELTFTVSFQNELEEEVVQATASIPAETAKAIVATWTQPKEEVTLTAVVTHAYTKQKKEIKTLHGEVGKVNVGAVEEEKKTKNSSISLPSKEAIFAWISTNLSSVEAFREKQSEKYTALRDDAKEKSGVTEVRDILERYDEDTGKAEPVIPAVDKDKTGNYAMSLFYTSMAAFFSNKGVFYIGLVIITLFVVRFIFSRFI